MPPKINQEAPAKKKYEGTFIKLDKDTGAYSLTLQKYTNCFGTDETVGDELYNKMKGNYYYERDLKLYPNGDPKPQDVIQTRNGSCYFMAVLRTMAAQDPESIKKLVTVSKDVPTKATVHFFARKYNEDGTVTKVPYDVTVQIDHSAIDEYTTQNQEIGWIAVVQKAYFASMLWKTNGELPTVEEMDTYYKLEDKLFIIQHEQFKEAAKEYGEHPFLMGLQPDVFVSVISKEMPPENQLGGQLRNDMINTHDKEKATELFSQSLLEAWSNKDIITFEQSGHVISVENVEKGYNGRVEITYFDQLHNEGGTCSVEDLLNGKVSIGYVPIGSVSILNSKNGETQHVGLNGIYRDIDNYFRQLDDGEQKKEFAEYIKKDFGKVLSESGVQKFDKMTENILPDFLKSDDFDSLFHQFQNEMKKYGLHNPSPANFEEALGKGENETYLAAHATFHKYLSGKIDTNEVRGFMDHYKIGQDDVDKLKTFMQAIKPAPSKKLENQSIKTPKKTRSQELDSLNTNSQKNTVSLGKSEVREKVRTADDISNRVKSFYHPEDPDLKVADEKSLDLLTGLAHTNEAINKDVGWSDSRIQNVYRNILTSNGKDISAAIPKTKFFLKMLKSDWNNSSKYKKIITNLDKVEKYCLSEEPHSNSKLASLLLDVKEAASDYISYRRGEDENARSNLKVNAAAVTEELVEEYFKELGVTKADAQAYKENEMNAANRGANHADMVY